MKNKFFISLACVLFSIPALSEVFTEGVLKYYLSSEWDGFVTVCGVSENFRGGGITIPAKVRNYNVTGIRSDAFRGCTSLTSIVIPKTVTTVGGGAFSGCTNLTSLRVENGHPVYDSRNDCNAIIWTEKNTLVCGYEKTTIPNTVTSIGEEAFYGCTDSFSIVIPNSVTSIGKGVFQNCTGLISIELSNSITYIYEDTFSGCTSLGSIKFPSSIIGFYDDAFYGCSGLKTVDFSELTFARFMYGDAFNECPYIETIVLRSDNHFKKAFALFSSETHVRDIYLQNFEQWDKTESETNSILKTCEKLENDEGELTVHYMQNGNELTQIETPDSLTSIGGFVYGRNIESVTLTDNITRINERAFQNCSNLCSLTLGNSLTTIATDFSGCKNIKEVRSLNPTPPTFYDAYPSQYGFAESEVYEGTLYVPVGSAQAYSMVFPWNKFKNIVEGTAIKVPVQISVSEGGKVVLPDTAICNDSYNFQLESGSTLILNVEAAKGYRVVSVLVNGEESIMKLKNGTLTIDSIAGATSIEIKFEEARCVLSVATSEGGHVYFHEGDIIGDNYSTKVLIDYRATFDISIDEGYFLKSVTLNGEDVTDSLTDNKLTIEEVTNDSSIVVNIEKLEDDTPPRQDVNTDGEVNTADVVAIYNYIINGE